MTQLIEMEIYRTKSININNNQYTIRFAVNKDESEYTMFVSNETDQKQSKYSFQKETADNFGKVTGEELKELVESFIRTNGII